MYDVLCMHKNLSFDLKARGLDPEMEGLAGKAVSGQSRKKRTDLVPLVNKRVGENRLSSNE